MKDILSVLGEFGALYVSDRSNRRYFSKTDILDGIVIVFDKIYYFIDARYYYGVKEKLINLNVVPVLYNGKESLQEFIEKHSISSLYVDYDTVTLTEYNGLKEICKDIKDGTKLLKNLRSVKNEYEIGCIQKACDITIKAYYEGIKKAKEGITEKQLRDIIDNLMLSYGAEEIAFSTIVAFGENSAVPHHVTSDRALKRGDVILIDMGCKINGYCSDLTRTAFYGTPTIEFIDCYNAVLKANLLAEEMIAGDMSCRLADQIARNYLADLNLEKHFTHSLGHGVGLDIHESPVLSFRSSETLLENTVFTVEPGIYMPGKFGIRIEDTVIIKNGKVKRFYFDDKGLNILTK